MGLTPGQALPTLRVVGQVRLTYIVAEGPDGVYLVDQHAAHERVLFDVIMRQAADHVAEIQSFQMPAPLEVKPSQMYLFQNTETFRAC